MKTHVSLSQNGPTQVVGSIAGPQDLQSTTGAAANGLCDIVELRLDLLAKGFEAVEGKPWQHLAEMPLLFTARRSEEGGALPLSSAERMAMLEAVLDDAALIDIEVASIPEMQPLIEQLEARQQAWIASYHDFAKLPDRHTLIQALEMAKAAGAHAFKVAAHLDGPASMAMLAEFQLEDHGLPVATMGMGPLAPVSRLLCAQAGSVLNYGYIGTTPTAPGQWDAGFLKQAIARLADWQRA